MVASALCAFLALPGNILRGWLNAVTGNWALTLLAVVGIVILLSFLTVITSFELLELIPVLSFLIDWLEILVLSPLGPVLFVWTIISLGISYGLIPCSTLL